MRSEAPFTTLCGSVKSGTDLDDARDPAEVAERGLQGTEDVDGADPRRLSAFLDRELAPDLADELHPVRGHRHLAGHEDQLAGGDGRHIVCRRRRRSGQVDA